MAAKTKAASKGKKTATKPKVSQPKAAPSKAAPAPELKKSRLRRLRPRRPRPRIKRSERQPVHWTGSFRLLRDSLLLIAERWKVFGGILFVYILLTVILAGGANNKLDLPQLRDQLHETNGNNAGSLDISLSLLGTMLNSSNTNSAESASTYQVLLIIIISLATIWTLRQVLASRPATARDAFYKGLYPFAPFVLVLVVMGLQLIPLVLAGGVYQIAFLSGLAVGLPEQLMWGVAAFLLALGSLYMLCSSLFALYIVTLPDMAPLQALRSARGLVRYRRWTIMRKLLFLPLILMIIGTAIILPMISLLPALAQGTLLLLSLCALIVGHTYIYHLYRELL